MLGTHWIEAYGFDTVVGHGFDVVANISACGKSRNGGPVNPVSSATVIAIAIIFHLDFGENTGQVVGIIEPNIGNSFGAFYRAAYLYILATLGQLPLHIAHSIMGTTDAGGDAVDFSLVTQVVVAIGEKTFQGSQTGSEVGISGERAGVSLYQGVNFFGQSIYMYMRGGGVDAAFIDGTQMRQIALTPGRNGQHLIEQRIIPVGFVVKRTPGGSACSQGTIAIYFDGR